MSTWNPDNVRDVAESVGIAVLNDEVIVNLARDVEYRISLVLEEALKFMRHGKRTTLTTQDISQALRVLDVEPLYGYDSTRPLRFGEASLGPGQPLFYVEDEEVDFEKLINAPLPKVPREVSFTAHWLAVEGVQPTIPQNPTSADSRNQELHPRGAGTNHASLAALTGDDNITVRPLVKHILSKELQLYFDRICSAILDPDHDDSRIAAFTSLGTDPGLHQLVPYFVQFIAEKVTHNLKDIFVLTQMMTLTSAMLENASLYIDPYVASIVPPILTCLVGRRLGDVQKPAHFDLRDLAASLIGRIATKYGKSSQTLKPRLARTCLKHFLDPHKPLGVHYGAIAGLVAVGGTEVVRVLIVPNLKPYEGVIRDHLTENSPRRGEAEKVVRQLMKALRNLEKEQTQFPMTNGNGAHGGEMLQARINDKVGEVIGTRLIESGNMAVIHAILE